MKDDSGRHLNRAAELLRVAKSLIENGFPADSVGRSYYAMFHAATALLMELGVERTSHHGIVSAFSEFVVRKGIMENRYHQHFHRAFEARHNSDYRSVPPYAKEGAESLLQNATEFVGACRAFLEKNDAGAA